jgi:hypothetical protein
MKAFAGMFVGGTIALILFKLLATLLLPLLGAMIGFFFTVMKLLLLAAVAYFVYSMIFKKKREQEVA